MIALLMATYAAVAAPMSLTHQGRLVGSTGDAVDGATHLRLALYDEAGTELWSKPYPAVPVDDGFYSVALSGADDHVPPRTLDTALLAEPELWVAVSVGSTELGPRTRLLQVPYAGHAATASQAESVPVSSTSGACPGEGSIRWNPAAAALQVCTASAWLNIGPIGIVMADGARRYANGTSATTCEAYRNSVSGPYIGEIGDGLYWIAPAGTAYKAWCDMTTAGGGWTMCYSEQDSSVNFTTETTSAAAYGTDGYRADCRSVPFSEVLYYKHSNSAFARFTRNTAGDVTIAPGYPSSGSTWGGWTAASGASTSWTYQLMACNTSMYVGLFMSGITSSCYKSCDSWCSDTSSPYFRVHGSSAYSNVAFNANGHAPSSVQLMSVGVR
jgi:hypothetical protein